MKNMLASIDVGAHSARLLIVEVDSGDGSYEAIEDLEIPVPLGADVFKTGRISNHSVEMLCGIMKKFKLKLDEYRIKNCKAIATSAVREALNADVFLERIRHLSGIELKIFSGADEARLGYLAIRSSIPESFGFDRQRVLLADIGTGACQVSVYEYGIMRFTETVRLGTLRVVENISETSSPAARIEYLAPMIGTAFGEMEYLSNKLECDAVIVTGASSRTLLSMTPRSRVKKGVVELTVAEFQNLMDLASTMTVEALGEKYEIKSDLAEAVLPCCLMIKNLIRLTGAATIVAPSISTKYALTEDYISERLSGTDPFESQILGMASITARRYGCDYPKITRTMDFAEKLFNGLKSLHGMSHRDLLLLNVAAALHKTGLFITNQAYHKHSCYIILNTEIPGLSLEERKVVAMIARYHRKSLPKPQHLDYMALPQEKRFSVHKLAALLRLACGLSEVYPDGAELQFRIARELVSVKTAGGVRCADLSVIDDELFHYAYAMRIAFS